jgi:toxin YhaV
MPETEWKILFFSLFKEQYKDLVLEVSQLKAKQPGTYKTHPKTKLLGHLQKAIFKDVPADPCHAKYNLGKTLGLEYKNFKRVKQELPSRYRLFFRFDSESKMIIFIWMNDEHSLRKKGSRRDVYAVFKQMIERGEVPKTFDRLKSSSEE